MAKKRPWDLSEKHIKEKNDNVENQEWGLIDFASGVHRSFFFLEKGQHTLLIFTA